MSIVLAPCVPETPLEQLYTLKEAMQYLRVSRSTVYRLMEHATLKGYKVGKTWRFYEDDLRACIVCCRDVHHETTEEQVQEFIEFLDTFEGE